MANVLIVDDDDDIASLLEILLASRGHDVHVAHDGRQALGALKTDHLPDLVITDAEMPNLDAQGMAYEMFYTNCGKERIPIVLISGSSEIERIAQRIGTPYVLPKPFMPDDVLACADRALDEKRPFHPTR